eukprot:c53468_g1_i1 orf=715-1092(+)
MATENPLRLIAGDGLRAGLESLGDALRSSAGGGRSSAPSNAGVAQELGLLLRGHSGLESVLSRGEMLPYRSGSAPPSVEGSLAAIDSLCADRTPATEIGAHIVNSSSRFGTDIVESEQELRSDPA